jgi:hypothetical protein
MSSIHRTTEGEFLQKSFVSKKKYPIFQKDSSEKVSNSESDISESEPPDSK